jgi:hypothetical protein
MTGELFLAYVGQCWVAIFRRDDILVAGIQEAIERARATLRYLPKYSPDLSGQSVLVSRQLAMKDLLYSEAAGTNLESVSCPERLR